MRSLDSNGSSMDADKPPLTEGVLSAPLRLLTVDKHLAAADSLQKQQNQQKQQKGRPRGRPFAKGQSGNPRGRPPGNRNKATRAAEALLAGEAEALTRKAVQMALSGNAVALKLCLERLVAPRREPAAELALPPMREVGELPDAMAALAAAVARGTYTAAEAESLGRLLQGYMQMFHANDVAARVRQVEETLAKLAQQ
jgi:hypothetical protein